MNAIFLALLTVSLLSGHEHLGRAARLLAAAARMGLRALPDHVQPIMRPLITLNRGSCRTPRAPAPAAEPLLWQSGYLTVKAAHGQVYTQGFPNAEVREAWYRHEEQIRKTTVF